jgi:hypothetical protein
MNKKLDLGSGTDIRASWVNLDRFAQIWEGETWPA